MSLATVAKLANDLAAWDPYPDSGSPARTDERPAAASLASPRAAARRPVVVGGRHAPQAQAPGQAAADRSPWLRTATVPRVGVNPSQYLRELERFIAEEGRREMQEAVIDVSSAEIENVARLAAKLRGRYIARLLDAASPSRRGGGLDGEMRELTRARTMAEEMEQGLTALQRAIESGELRLNGIAQR